MFIDKSIVPVYLCGPINGCSDDEAINWREYVKSKIGAENCIDPMRRDYRGREDECLDEIVELDKKDILNSKIVLANCWKPSPGTSMEILYSYDHYIPVISIVKSDEKVSPWIKYHSTVVTSVDDALDYITGVI